MHNALASCEVADGQVAASTPARQEHRSAALWRILGYYARKRADYRECLAGQILGDPSDDDHNVNTIAKLVLIYAFTNSVELTDAVPEAEFAQISAMAVLIGERKQAAKAVFERHSQLADVEKETVELLDTTLNLHRKINLFVTLLKPRTLDVIVRRVYAAMLQNSPYVLRQLGEYCCLIGDAFQIARKQGIVIPVHPFKAPGKLLKALKQARADDVLRAVVDPAQYTVPVYTAGFAFYGNVRRISRALDRLPSGSELQLTHGGSFQPVSPKSLTAKDRVADAVIRLARQTAVQQAGGRQLDFATADRVEHFAYSSFPLAGQGTQSGPQPAAGVGEQGSSGSPEEVALPSTSSVFAAPQLSPRPAPPPVQNSPAVSMPSMHPDMCGVSACSSGGSISAGKQRLDGCGVALHSNSTPAGQVPGDLQQSPVARCGEVPSAIPAPLSAVPHGGQEPLTSTPYGTPLQQLFEAAPSLSDSEAQVLLNVIMRSRGTGQSSAGKSAAGVTLKAEVPPPMDGVPVHGFMHGEMEVSAPVKAYTAREGFAVHNAFTNPTSQGLWMTLCESAPNASEESLLSIRCLFNEPSTGIMFKTPNIVSILGSAPVEPMALKMYSKTLVNTLTPQYILLGCPEPNAEGSIGAYVEFRPHFIERCLQWVLILGQTASALHMSLTGYASSQLTSSNHARWRLLCETTCFDEFFERLDGLYSDRGFAHSDETWISATKQARNVLELFQSLRSMLTSDDRKARARRDIHQYIKEHYGSSAPSFIAQLTSVDIGNFDGCEALLCSFVDAHKISNPAKDTRKDSIPPPRPPGRGPPAGPAPGIAAAFSQRGMLKGPKPMYDLHKVYEYLGLDTNKIPGFVGPHQDGTHGEECLVCSQIFNLQFCYWDKCVASQPNIVAYHKAWSCKRIEEAVKKAAERKGDGPEVVEEVLRHIQPNRPSSRG